MHKTGFRFFQAVLLVGSLVAWIGGGNTTAQFPPPILRQVLTTNAVPLGTAGQALFRVGADGINWSNLPPTADSVLSNAYWWAWGSLSSNSITAKLDSNVWWDAWGSLSSNAITGKLDSNVWWNSWGQIATGAITAKLDSNWWWTAYGAKVLTNVSQFLPADALGKLTNNGAGVLGWDNSAASGGDQVWTNDGTKIFITGPTNPVIFGSSKMTILTNYGTGIYLTNNLDDTRVSAVSMEIALSGGATEYETKYPFYINLWDAGLDTNNYSGLSGIQIASRCNPPIYVGSGLQENYASIGIAADVATAGNQTAGLLMGVKGKAGGNFGTSAGGVFYAVGMSTATNIGLAGLAIKTSSGQSASIYGAMGDSFPPTEKIDNTVLLLESDITGVPLIIARTNNGTHVFELDGLGVLNGNGAGLSNVIPANTFITNNAGFGTNTTIFGSAAATNALTVTSSNAVFSNSVTGTGVALQNNGRVDIFQTNGTAKFSVGLALTNRNFAISNAPINSPAIYLEGSSDVLTSPWPTNYLWSTISSDIVRNLNNVHTVFCVSNTMNQSGTFNTYRVLYTEPQEAALHIQKNLTFDSVSGTTIDMIGSSTATDDLVYGGHANQRTTSLLQKYHNFTGTLSPASGTPTNLFFNISPTFNWGGSMPRNGHYEALRILVTKTSVPSEKNYLIRGMTNGEANLFYVDDIGNTITSGTLVASNGVVNVGAGDSIANITITTNSTQIWCVSGTNQLITLPDCTKVPAYQFYRFSSTNGYGSVVITNATGAQTIRNGTSLDYKVNGVFSVAFFTDGATWLIGSKAKTIWPNASWSTTTNVPFAVATSNYITFDQLETSNAQGITLTNGYQIYVRDAGQYLLTFSLVMQVGHNNDTNRVWLQQSGVNIPRTRTDVKLTTTAEQSVMTVNFVLPVVTNLTWFGICLRSTDTGAQLVTGAAADATMPAMPSAIVTVNKISDTFP